MSPVGFKPTISAGERPQTCALDRAAIGTGNDDNNDLFNLLTPNVNYSVRTATLTSKVSFYMFIQQI